jgi:hypothetical protein
MIRWDFFIDRFPPGRDEKQQIILAATRHGYYCLESQSTGKKTLNTHINKEIALCPVENH